jgi:hypothetical protein
MGALISSEGTPPGAEWLVTVIWTALLILGIRQLYRRARAGDEISNFFAENELAVETSTAPAV